SITYLSHAHHLQDVFSTSILRFCYLQSQSSDWSLLFAGHGMSDRDQAPFWYSSERELSWQLSHHHSQSCSLSTSILTRTVISRLKIDDLFVVVHARWLCFFFCVLSVSSGLLGFMILLRANLRELKQLQRLSGHTSMKYSIARIYQLRENIDVMKMILRMAVPFFKYTTPVMALYFIFISIPGTRDNQTARDLSMAFFDWWLAVLSLAVALTLPIFDFRFRRVAIQLPIFRSLMKANDVHSARVFTTEHVFNDTGRATSIYFSSLEREWNR
ncbi:hypothetical protein PMAYCL1PPCAC_15371, partial [Pristionchus mayeri]